MGTGMDEDGNVFEPSQYDHWFGFPPKAQTPLLPLKNQPCNATPSVAPLAPLTDVGDRNKAKKREPPAKKAKIEEKKAKIEMTPEEKEDNAPLSELGKPNVEGHNRVLSATIVSPT